MARDIIDHEDGLSIICGGTGLYLKSCLYDYEFMQESDSFSDPELEKLDTDTLYEMLLKSDPAQTEKIHRNNRRRMIRSLTIQKRSGMKQSDLIGKQKHEMIYDTMIVGCTMPREILHERIALRVNGMFANGLKEEIEKLLNIGVTFDMPAMKGIGYREWKAFFDGQCSEEEVKEQIIIHSRQFAKRQYTWLNHQMPVEWFQILDHDDRQAMIRKIDHWYESS